MTTPTTPKRPKIPPQPLDPIGGVLSYLIPGLGQITQGRTAKGLVFLFGIYAMFFYGMTLGHWNNVYLREVSPPNAGTFAKLTTDLFNRPQFAGQFWIGIAAWPAIHQYATFDKTQDRGKIFGRFQRAPDREQENIFARDLNKRWDLGWICTVIAGVLNVLVIYDAVAGPVFREVPEPKKQADTPATASSPPPNPNPPAVEVVKT